MSRAGAIVRRAVPINATPPTPEQVARARAESAAWAAYRLYDRPNFRDRGTTLDSLERWAHAAQCDPGLKAYERYAALTKIAEAAMRLHHIYPDQRYLPAETAEPGSGQEIKIELVLDPRFTGQAAG